MTFTSGGTEANNMALRGVGAEDILVSAVEHPSVLAAAKASGKTVELIPVDGFGRVKVDVLQACWADQTRWFPSCWPTMKQAWCSRLLM